MIWGENSSESRDLLIPDIFSNGMIVLQERPIVVWGEGNSDQPVIVEFAGVSKTASFEGSRWTAVFEPQKAKGQVLLMKISTNDKVVREITDIQVGEVWLASGQSNMEMHLNMTKEGVEALKCDPDPLLRESKSPSGHTFHAGCKINSHEEK